MKSKKKAATTAAPESGKAPVIRVAESQILANEVQVASKRGVRRRVDLAAKLDKPVLEAEMPWELGKQCGNNRDWGVYVYGTGLGDEVTGSTCRVPGTLLVLLAGVGMVGCGQQGPRRYDLFGQVTYEGKPVPMGEISLDPAERGVGGGFAPITDGRFDTSVDGRGHLGGEHRVRIVGFSGWVDPNDPDRGAIPLAEPYETTLELPTNTNTMVFEVSARQE